MAGYGLGVSRAKDSHVFELGTNKDATLRAVYRPSIGQELKPLSESGQRIKQNTPPGKGPQKPNHVHKSLPIQRCSEQNPGLQLVLSRTNSYMGLLGGSVS